MQRKIKLFLLSFGALLYTVGYYQLVKLYWINVETWIKIIVYLFLLWLFVGPFLSTKRNKPSIFNKFWSGIQSSNKEEEELFKLAPIDLDGEYKAPLFQKCACGFLLTRNMKRCPKCGRSNPFYKPTHQEPL
ncbi:MAG: hypothetical protein ACTSU2_13800 [Promethearchaeota archaeon]